MWILRNERKIKLDEQNQVRGDTAPKGAVMNDEVRESNEEEMLYKISQSDPLLLRYEMNEENAARRQSIYIGIHQTQGNVKVSALVNQKERSTKDKKEV